MLPPAPEYPFGDTTHSFDVAAWTRVFDALKPRHPRLTLRSYLLPLGERPEVLKAYYDRALPDQGWREVPRLPTLPGRTSWAFGYEKGRYVFAVVGLADRFAGGGRLPLNILTDVPEPPTP